MLFESLQVALAKLYEKPFAQLPKKLQHRIQKEFQPSWDDLSSSQRRQLAELRDYSNDPAMESYRQYWLDFYQRMQIIENQIEHWASIATPTATDLAAQEKRLAELKLELASMKIQEQQSQNLIAVRAQLLKQQPAVVQTEYIAYPKAMKLLTAKLGAKPEEVGVWVWFGSGQGGLNAYVNANELSPPPKFSFAHLGWDYLSPLMACWFDPNEIANFQPGERYITGSALIERWNKQPDILADAFILAKIAESRLLDFHPMAGLTQWSKGENLPPKELALFAMSHIEAIEREDFGIEISNSLPTAKPSGHLNHDQEWQTRANEIATKLKADKKRVPTKNEVATKLAEEIETPFDTVLRRIRAEWK